MRQRSLFVVFALLVVLLILTNLRLPFVGQFSNQIKETLSEGFIPFLEFSSRVRGTVHDLINRVKGYHDLQVESTELHRQLSELSVRVAQISEIERENRNFRAMLDFKDRSELKLVSAKVIGRDPSNWWNTILVDRGITDGITRDMPVLTVEGLVGKTLEPGQNNVQVILLVDENCKVSGRTNESGQYGIVQGNILAGATGSQCQITFVNRSAQLKINEKVFTSGLGEVFPKGILIGTVGLAMDARNQAKHELYQKVSITPAVDLLRIDEVFIGVGTKPSEKTRSSHSTPKPR